MHAQKARGHSFELFDVRVELCHDNTNHIPNDISYDILLIFPVMFPAISLMRFLLILLMISLLVFLRYQ